MVRAVTEAKGAAQNYATLFERRPDLTERIFYGSPKFVERMEREHGASLETLGAYRRKARQRNRTKPASHDSKSQ